MNDVGSTWPYFDYMRSIIDGYANGDGLERDID